MDAVSESSVADGAAGGERRPCFDCNLINAAGAAACEHCGADLRDVPLRRDLKMEAHLSAIAMWIHICGYLTALIGLILVMMKFTRFETYRIINNLGDLPLPGIGLASILVGVYLARFSNFARITAGILTALAMMVQMIILSSSPYDTWLFLRSFSFMVCVGAVLGPLIDRRAAVVCSEGYRGLVDFRRGVPPGTYRSPFLWVPLVGVALFIPVIAAKLIEAFSLPPWGCGLD
jgi:hypothetical protein